jgi:hypothetical protein
LNKENETVTLTQADITSRATVYFKNCTNCHYTIDGECTKIMIGMSMPNANRNHNRMKLHQHCLPHMCTHFSIRGLQGLHVCIQHSHHHRDARALELPKRIRYGVYLTYTVLPTTTMNLLGSS